MSASAKRACASGTRCAGPCGRSLPLSDEHFQQRLRFVPGRGNEQQWTKKCRECTRESMVEAAGERSKRTLAEIVSGGTKRCSRCGLDKAVSLDSAATQFRLKPRKPGCKNHHQSFFRAYCKQCDVELAREQRSTHKYQQWKIASRERRAEYSKKWKKAHPGRAQATTLRCYERYKARVPLEKRRAVNVAKTALARAVASGTVVKPSSCERCDANAAPSGGRIRAVFRDISVRPARVEWVCYGHFRAAARSDVARDAADTGVGALESLTTEREEWREIHEEHEAEALAENGAPDRVAERTAEEHLRVFCATPYTKPRRSDLMLMLALGDSRADPDWEPDYD